VAAYTPHGVPRSRATDRPVANCDSPPPIDPGIFSICSWPLARQCLTEDTGSGVKRASDRRGRSRGQAPATLCERHVALISRDSPPATPGSDSQGDSGRSEEAASTRMRRGDTIDSCSRRSIFRDCVFPSPSTPALSHECDTWCETTTAESDDWHSQSSGRLSFLSSIRCVIEIARTEARDFVSSASTDYPRK